MYKIIIILITNSLGTKFDYTLTNTYIAIKQEHEHQTEREGTFISSLSLGEIGGLPPLGIW